MRERQEWLTPEQDLRALRIITSSLSGPAPIRTAAQLFFFCAGTLLAGIGAILCVLALLGPRVAGLEFITPDWRLLLAAVGAGSFGWGVLVGWHGFSFIDGNVEQIQPRTTHTHLCDECGKRYMCETRGPEDACSSPHLCPRCVEAK